MCSDHYSGWHPPAFNDHGIITTLNTGRMDPPANAEIGDTHEKEVISD
jgi:hypothetical protein